MAKKTETKSPERGSTRRLRRRVVEPDPVETIAVVDLTDTDPAPPPDIDPEPWSPPPSPPSPSEPEWHAVATWAWFSTLPRTLPSAIINDVMRHHQPGETFADAWRRSRR